MATKPARALASLWIAFAASSAPLCAPTHAIFLPAPSEERARPFLQSILVQYESILTQEEGSSLAEKIAAQKITDLGRSLQLLDHTLTTLFSQELRLTPEEMRYIDEQKEAIFRQAYAVYQQRVEGDAPERWEALAALSRTFWEGFFAAFYGQDAQQQQLEGLQASTYTLIRNHFEAPGHPRGPFAPRQEGGFARRFTKAWGEACKEFPPGALAESAWEQLLPQLAAARAEGDASFVESFRFLLAHLPPDPRPEASNLSRGATQLASLALLPYWLQQYQGHVDQLIRSHAAELPGQLQARSASGPLADLVELLGSLRHPKPPLRAGQGIGLAALLSPASASAAQAPRLAFLATAPELLQGAREALEARPATRVNRKPYLYALRKELAFKRIRQGIFLLDATLERSIDGPVRLQEGEKKYLRKQLNKIAYDFHENMLKTQPHEERAELLRLQQLSKLFWQNLYHLLAGSEGWAEGEAPIRASVRHMISSHFSAQLTPLTGPFSPTTRLATFPHQFIQSWHAAYQRLPATPQLSDKACQLLLDEWAEKQQKGQEASAADIGLILLAHGNLPAPEGSVYARFRTKLNALLLLPSWDPLIRKHMEKLVLENQTGLLGEFQTHNPNGGHLQAIARGIDILASRQSSPALEEPAADALASLRDEPHEQADASRAWADERETTRDHGGGPAEEASPHPLPPETLLPPEARPTPRTPAERHGPR